MPDSPHRAGTLEFQRNLRLQGLERRAQTVGRVILAAFLVAGVLGVFGGGWVGQSEVVDATGRLKIRHPRFARADSRYELRVDVDASLVSNGTLALWIERSVLGGLKIETVQPEPAAQVLSLGRIEYRFHVDASESLPPVIFYATAMDAGPCRGAIGVDGGPQLPLWHFVFP